MGDSTSRLEQACRRLYYRHQFPALYRVFISPVSGERIRSLLLDSPIQDEEEAELLRQTPFRQLAPDVLAALRSPDPRVRFGAIIIGLNLALYRTVDGILPAIQEISEDPHDEWSAHARREIRRHALMAMARRRGVPSRRPRLVPSLSAALIGVAGLLLLDHAFRRAGLGPWPMAALWAGCLVVWLRLDEARPQAIVAAVCALAIPWTMLALALAPLLLHAAP